MIVKCNKCGLNVWEYNGEKYSIIYKTTIAETGIYTHSSLKEHEYECKEYIEGIDLDRKRREAAKAFYKFNKETRQQYNGNWFSKIFTGRKNKNVSR